MSTKKRIQSIQKVGTRRGDRTHDHWIKSPTLYRWARRAFVLKERVNFKACCVLEKNLQKDEQNVPQVRLLEGHLSGAFSSVVERPFCIREAEGSNPSMSIFLPYFVDYFLVGPVKYTKIWTDIIVQCLRWGCVWWSNWRVWPYNAFRNIQMTHFPNVFTFLSILLLRNSGTIGILLGHFNQLYQDTSDAPIGDSDLIMASWAAE